MAGDPSDIDWSQYQEAILEVTSRYGGLQQATKSLAARMTLDTKDIKDNNEAYKRVMRERKREEEAIIKAQREGNLTYKEAQTSLQKLNDEIRAAVPEELKKTFEDTIAYDGIKNDLTMRYSGLLKGLSLTTQALSTTFAHSFKLMGSLSPSVDPLGGALDAATESVKLLGSALKLIGNNATSAALGAAVFGPEASLAAGGLAMLSGVLGDAVTFLGNNVMPVFNTYVKSLSSGFKDAATAGGLFVGGLTELQSTALDAGVNTETFGKLLKEQSSNLLLFGGDVVEGGRRVAAVTRQLQRNLGPDYQSYFVKMGYSVQEIPGIIAQVGADVSRTMGGATNEQVARAVQDYAKNLRVIADLTGQDAKTLQEKAANEFKDLRYRQFLSDLQEKFGPLYRKQFEMQAAALPEAELKLLKEKIAGQGNIYSQAGGIIASQIPAFDASTSAAYNLAVSGQMTSTSLLDLSQANSQAAAAQMQSVKDFAAAGIITGQFTESLTAIQNSYDRVIANANQTAEEYEKKRDTLLKATETNDRNTQKLADAEIKGMELKIAAEQEATVALGNYLAGITKINELNIMLIRSTGALVEFINNRLPGGGLTVSQTDQAESDAENARLQRRLNSQTTANLTQQISGALSDSQRNIVQSGGANVPDPVRDRLGFLRYSASRGDEESRAELLMLGEDINRISEHALGGIAMGPKTGYLAKLHGTEAVLPEDLTNMLLESAKSNEVIRNQLPQAINAPNKSEELLSMLNSKFDDMIGILDDISNHTERTSVRVA